MKKHILTGFLCLSCLFSANIALANDDEETVETGDVNVYGEEYQVSGSTTTVTAEEIQMIPKVSNNVTDLLRGEASVQFDTTSRSALTGGEITPSQISINGARYYENNYTINGISNNSVLNVNGYTSTGSGATNNTVPSGDSQSIFINTNLIDSVEVFTENVSAQYGGFIGGVVNSTLKDASTDAWHGQFAYGGFTNNYLTNFHYYEGTTPSNDVGTTVKTNQPYFQKGLFSAYIDGPVKDWFGLLVSYSNNHSTIPLTLANYDNQIVESTRSNENFMLRINTGDENPLYAAVTFIYAPYEAKLFNANYNNEEDAYYTVGGGTSIILNTKYNANNYLLNNDFGFSMTEVSRTANSSTLYAYADNTEGGLGDYINKQNTISWKSVAELEPINLMFIENNILAGLETSFINAYADGTGYTSYTTPISTTGVTGDLSGTYVGTDINGDEYYFSRKTILYADEHEYSFLKLALFAEDTLNIERLSIRPGVRAEYDTLMSNLDIAPRLFANVDVLNNNKINVFGGYNRYYGSQLISKLLSLSSTVDEQYITTATEYNPDTGEWGTHVTPNQSNYLFKELNTPYTDEFSIGASINLFDTLFKADYIKRDNQDQLMLQADFVSADGVGYNYEYSNKGKSNYEGLTLSIEKGLNLGKIGKHKMGLSATNSKVSGNFLDWNSLDDAILITDSSYSTTLRDYTYAVLDDELILRTDLPATNFNSPWVIAYTHNASFLENDKLRLYGQVRWEQGGDRITYTGTVTTANALSIYDVVADGYLIKYETIDQENMFNTDISIEYDIYEAKGAIFTLEASVLNLFDTVNLDYSTSTNLSTTTTPTAYYSMGRQFYFGGKYTF